MRGPTRRNPRPSQTERQPLAWRKEVPTPRPQVEPCQQTPLINRNKRSPCRTSKANNKIPPVPDAVRNSPSRKEGERTASEFFKYFSAESASTSSLQMREKTKPTRRA